MSQDPLQEELVLKEGVQPAWADLVVDRDLRGRKKQELLARDNAIASKPAFASIPFL
jgi:hypothetical protein